MPNQSSHAGHIPQRRCVICRQSLPQPSLLRFIMIEGRYVFDPKRQLPGRGFYLCEQEECISRFDKWLKKRKKRK